MVPGRLSEPLVPPAVPVAETSGTSQSSTANSTPNLRTRSPSNDLPPSPLAKPIDVPAFLRARSSSLSSIGSDNFSEKRNRREPHRTLGVTAVLFITFFNVSGGPWGSEGMFSLGPFWGIVGGLCFTIGFSLPQCLLTTELSSAFPTNGGYSIWCREAFGTFWGVQQCYWSWTSGVIDNAIYPVLFVDCMKQLLGAESGDHLYDWRGKVLFTILFSLPLAFSDHTFSSALQMLGIFMFIPVAIFVISNVGVADSSVWLEAASNGFSFSEMGNFTLVLFWSLSGWDCISTCAGQIVQPMWKSLKWGLLMSLWFSTFQYLVVLLVCANVGHSCGVPWTVWKDGSILRVAGESMGSYMGAWLLLASLAGNAGMFMAELFEDSYQLEGVANFGLVPKALGWRHPRYNTPWVAIAFQVILIILITTMEFTEILAFDNFFTAIAALLEVVAFFRLRWARQDLERPYKMPTLLLPLVGLMPPIILFVCYHCLLKSSTILIINCTAAFIGILYGFWVTWWNGKEGGCDLAAVFEEVSGDLVEPDSMDELRI